VSEPSYVRLYLTAKKLRGIAHLVESMGEPLSLPEDMTEVNWGIGLLLEGLASEVREAAEEVEAALGGEGEL
jgi:hypothetical protein